MQNEQFEQDDFRLEENSQPNSSHFSKSQKIMAIFLAFFAVFIIILWMVQFQKSLTSPFNRGTTEDNLQSNLSSGGDQTDEQLKAKDTDKDGLSDYDELNIYKTSPYLEDSDSDSFSDKEEINNDKDPNCPVGSDCVNFKAGEEVATEDEKQNNPSSNSNTTAPAAPTNTPTSTVDINTLKSLDAPTLRQLLLDKGMDKTMLDNISDADLLKSFSEVLESN
jgi:hypothetical protein